MQTRVSVLLLLHLLLVEPVLLDVRNNGITNQVEHRLLSAAYKHVCYYCCCCW
jgi:hypothetical protein